LKTAADKYSDFVAGQLAPGVVEAYQFQSRLWAAKHPGQPLPKGMCHQAATMFSETVIGAYLSHIIFTFFSIAE
jgi:hypothetical protein